MVNDAGASLGILASAIWRDRRRYIGISDHHFRNFSMVLAVISCLSTDHQIAVIESRIKHFKRNFKKAKSYPGLAKEIIEGIDETIDDVEKLLSKGKT